MAKKEVHHISKEQFMKIRVHFVKYMDDIESFIDEALANGLLTHSNKAEIMSQSYPSNQIRELHNIIHKKLPDGSEKFLSALENSKHNLILKLFDDPSVYPMRFKPHGRVIVINNVKFDDEEKYLERKGNEKDVEGIRKLFTAFNFVVEFYPNRTAEEMERIIEKASKETTNSEDCFVMFLMSHGAIGNIIGTDGEKLSYSTINNILKSKQLEDKPKLVYINTCQTDSSDKDVKAYFNVPDLYVSFATVPENLAFRTEESGSIFIKSLISVYERNKEECDISLLSLDINTQVVKESKKLSEEQTSSCYSTLKKKVILRATD